MPKIIIEITGTDIDPDSLAERVFELLTDDFPEICVTGYEVGEE